MLVDRGDYHRKNQQVYDGKRICPESEIKELSCTGFPFVYEYINCGGTKDNLKIEINYMLRCHVLPVARRER